MQHTLAGVDLGPQGPAMVQAIEKCVHCGFCLATCPTYIVLGEEMDSPRGRIYLMKNALEGELSVQNTLPFVDRCLGCLACVTACPSGVEYGNLLVPFRAMAEHQRSRPLEDTVARTLVNQTLPYPGRFRLAALAGNMAKPLQNLLPDKLSAMLDLLPTQVPAQEQLPEVISAKGARRARVALLAGCVQQVLSPAINQATIAVLTHNGVEVVIPRGQGCCGALALHTGEMAQACSLARHNLSVFPDDIDAIVTNAAGCGSGIHEYELLFAGTEWKERAVAFSERVVDISVFLDQLGLRPPIGLAAPRTVAYHDACHLAHAQRVTLPPRRLLAQIVNLTVVEIPEAELCCGSAGTYNLEQPELAAQIGRRKAENILTTDASEIVTGNIGCMTQLRTHLAGLGRPLPVRHTIELLAEAYRPAAPRPDS